MPSVEMSPPFSGAVVRVAEDSVEAFKAAGWTESKSDSSRKPEDKK